MMIAITTTTTAAPDFAVAMGILDTRGGGGRHDVCVCWFNNDTNKAVYLSSQYSILYKDI